MAWKTKGYDVAGIISSPLSRCHDLAQILAEQQLLPMTTEDDLQEMDFGDFDGMPFDLLTEHWKNSMPFGNHPLTIRCLMPRLKHIFLSALVALGLKSLTISMTTC